MFLSRVARAIGVHPRDNKGTRGMAFVEINDFSTLTIPLNLQIGPGCEPLVKKGDTVKVGQKLGEPRGHWSVPPHASASGTVQAVKKEILSNGDYAELIVIESDGQGTLHESVQPPVVTDKASFLTAIREAGLVGLGGAAFPTHVKLDPPADKPVDTLIINAAECEPFITADDQLMREQADHVLGGVLQVLKYLAIDSCLIGLEDNKPEAASALGEALEKLEEADRAKIQIRVLPTLYPTGAEKVLIRYLTQRLVPEDGLPCDVGVVVLNVGTVAFIDRLLKTGLPLIRKFVTIDGSAIKTPGNFDLPIGAPVEDIIEKVGGVKSPAEKIIMGGPMMGVAIDDIRQPVLKHTNALLFLDGKDALIPRETACIQCGRCVEHCTMNLMPNDLDVAARREDIEALIEGHVMNCCECGACTYVCPAKRYLVQNIRVGKTLYRQHMKKLKEAK